MNRPLGLALLLLAASTARAEDAGSIHVRGGPGLQVWLDGKFRGTTRGEDGCRIEGVEAGRHLLKVVRDGFQPRVVRIEVLGGKLATFEPPGFEAPIVIRRSDDFDFKDDDRNTARFAVETIPMRCTIDCETLDWVGIDKPGGCWIAEGLAVGEHTIRFTLDGKALEFTGRFDAGSQTCLRVDFPAAKTTVVKPGPSLTITKTARRELGVAVARVGFADEGKRLWTVGWRTFSLLSTKDLEPVPAAGPRADYLRTCALCVRDDGVTAFSALPEGRLVAWDTGSGEEKFSLIMRELNAPEAAVVLPGGERIAVADLAGVQVFDLKSRSRSWQYRPDNPKAIQSDRVQFSADGSRVFHIADLQHLHVCDAATGDVRREFESPAHAVSRFTTCPGRDLLAVALEDGGVRLWNPESGEVVHTLPQSQLPHRGTEPRVAALAASGAGLLAVCTWPENDLEFWDLRTGRRVGTLDAGLDAGSSLAFDGTGSLLATATSKGDVKIWSVER